MNSRIMICSSSSILGAIVLVFSLCASAQSSLEELQRLGEAQQYQAAYATAKQLYPQYVGTPEFDYWYGLASLNTQHLQEALFAFQRVLMNQPSNHRARLELARTHYELGEYANAKTEFERVLAIEPPPKVKEKVQSFLQAIDSREQVETRQQETQINSQLSMAVGHDTNINSATGRENFDIQIGGATISTAIDDVSQEQSDNFTEIKLGSQLTHPLSQRWSLLGGASYKRRDNVESSDFDTDTLAASTAASYKIGIDTLRVPLGVQKLFVSGDESRVTATTGLDWTRQLNKRHQLLAFGQYSALRYPDGHQRDSDLLVSGLGFTQLLSWKPIRLTETLYIGDDDTQDTDFNFYSKDFLGMRVTSQYQLTAEHIMYLSGGWQHAEYDEQGIFADVREDYLTDVQLGHRWQLEKEWATDLNLTYSNSKSTVAIYDYTRFQSSLGITYQF